MIQRAYFETIAKRIDEPRKFHPFRSVLVGEEGIPVETFLKSDLRELFE